MGYCYLCGKENEGGLGACAECASIPDPQPRYQPRKAKTETDNQPKTNKKKVILLLLVSFMGIGGGIGLILFPLSTWNPFTSSNTDWKFAYQNCLKRAHQEKTKAGNDSVSRQLSIGVLSAICDSIRRECETYPTGRRCLTVVKASGASIRDIKSNSTIRLR